MPFKEDAKQEISEEQKELENARAIAYLKSLKNKNKNQAKGDYLIMAEDEVANSGSSQNIDRLELDIALMESL